jgi:hypothetical protein
MPPIAASFALSRRARGGARVGVVESVWGFQATAEGRTVSDEPHNNAVQRTGTAPLLRASRPVGGCAVPAADGERYAYKIALDGLPA